MRPSRRSTFALIADQLLGKRFRRVEVAHGLRCEPQYVESQRTGHPTSAHSPQRLGNEPHLVRAFGRSLATSRMTRVIAKVTASNKRDLVRKSWSGVVLPRGASICLLVVEVHNT